MSESEREEIAKVIYKEKKYISDTIDKLTSRGGVVTRPDLNELLMIRLGYTKLQLELKTKH